MGTSWEIHGEFRGQVEVQRQSNFGRIIGRFWAEIMTHFMANFEGDFMETSWRLANFVGIISYSFAADFSDIDQTSV